MEIITLYYRQGSSDKVYQAAIEPKDGKFVVNFAYGRRGTTLQTGTKTAAAVAYGEAKAIYDKLVKEKTGKGYTPGEDGTPYKHTDKQTTGIMPQLLNPIEEVDLPRLIRDPAYWLQQKHDGRRLLVQKRGAIITGINKLGFSVAVPSTIEKAAQVFSQEFIIDGEAVGDVFHVFDLLSIDGESVTAQPYTDRYLHLMNLLASGQQRFIKLVQSAYMPKQKQDMLDDLRKQGREGVVFKHLSSNSNSVNRHHSSLAR
jgi:bifunctional non-homologous end joining protein LigD